MEHTTNYFNTFIEIAEDCPLSQAQLPPVHDEKLSAAALQFRLIRENPYHFSSDDILFKAYAYKHDLSPSEMESARETFFSKGQACLRASALAKRYGWGFHFNEAGKVAIYSVESPEYAQFKNDPAVKSLRAMRNKRK